MTQLSAFPHVMFPTLPSGIAMLIDTLPLPEQDELHCIYSMLCERKSKEVSRSLIEGRDVKEEPGNSTQSVAIYVPPGEHDPLMIPDSEVDPLKLEPSKRC